MAADLDITADRFITFEGVDGCGKTTQQRLTADWLRSQGFDVCATREPGDTPLGAKIRELLLSGEFVPVPESELLLFLADRAQHVREVIAPALASGAWVLCDRFTDSTLAYQLAARKLAKHADGLDALLAFAECGIQPNLTLWFDLPVPMALQRMRQRHAMGEASTRLDEEALSFHEAVAAGFASLQSAEPQRIRRIDAMATVENVQEAVRADLMAALMYAK
ncbi:MAG TPA: dTMP kinase [Mariprofundaceae bacterium]|nr:dTMP kinase [Mariprofundaceae bacterium]